MSEEVLASMDDAFDSYHSGRVDEACSLLDSILARDPLNAAALHLSGVISNGKNDFRNAASLIVRALALRPNVPNFHVNLAEAHRNLGDFRRAENCCRIALGLRPDFSEGLNTLGLVLHGAARYEEAIEQFGLAIAIKPDMASAHNNLGLALQELGRLDEAIARFQEAVAISPGLFRARTNLGLALMRCGRGEDALEQFQTAVALQPDLATPHHNLGNALRCLDRPVEARASYLEAILLEPDLPLTHLHIGLTLRGEGKLGEALFWYKRAVAIDPDNAVTLRQLAELHREREESGLAIPCWERLLELASLPDPMLNIGLGCALQDEGRIVEAMEQFRFAGCLQPDSVVVQSSLGSLHEILGEMAEAEFYFREAIRLQPTAPLPHAKLATLLRDKLPDPDLAALEARLDDSALDAQSRSHLLFALAHVLDAWGDYKRAAGYLLEANKLARECEKEYNTYKPHIHKKFVSDVCGAFDRAFFDRTAGASHETRRPVFVFGLPRSGTTLIEQVLASHPGVHGAGELRLGRQTFESIPAALNRTDPPSECIAHLDANTIRRLAEQHLDKLRLIDDGQSERIVDKMPDNYIFLGLLVTLFPNAVFIHCRRDLRDVAVSCWMTDFRSIPWASHPEHLASRFVEYRRLMDHWQSVLPARVHQVKYEETVSDLEGVARRLVTACGLDWDPACLEFHRSQRAVRTASIVQVRQPIYNKSVARWKNYETELADIFAMLPLDDQFAASQRAEVGIAADILGEIQGAPAAGTRASGGSPRALSAGPPTSGTGLSLAESISAGTHALTEAPEGIVAFEADGSNAREY